MSLSNALRAAALDRARRNGQTLDGVVIEPTGVIDLREMARSAGRETDHSVKLPVIAGYLQRTDREPEPALADTALWRRLRPVSPDAETAPADNLSPLDLDDLFEDVDSMAPSEPLVVDLSEVDEPTAVREDEMVSPVDATLADDAGRPVAVCNMCGSFGQRDLFDRFSLTEYYSCDDCGHMWQQIAED